MIVSANENNWIKVGRIILNYHTEVIGDEQLGSHEAWISNCNFCFKFNQNTELVSTC